MALPENMTVSYNPHAAESAAFTLVDSKNQKKQQQELAKLQTLITLLEGDLDQATSSDASPESGQAGDVGEAGSSAPSNPSFENAMADMALALQMLQVQIAKSANSKSKMDGEIAKSQIKMAQENLKAVTKQIEKIEKQEKKEKTEGFWEKLGEVLLAVVVDVVAVCTLNPATAAFLIAVSTAFLVASMTGGLKDLTNFCASGLEKLGIPKEAAEIISAVVITVVIIAITLVAAPEDAPEALGEGIGEIGEAAGGGAEVAADSVEGEQSTIQTIKNAASKLASPLKKAYQNTFGSLSTATNFAIMTGVQSAMQTGGMEDILTQIAKLDGKNSQKLEEILQTVMEVLSTIVTALAGAGATTGMASSVSDVEDVENLSKAGKVLKNLQEMATTTAGLRTFLGLQVMGSLTESGASAALGVTQYEQGGLEEGLAQLNANLQLLKSAQDMSSSQAKTDQTQTANTEKSQSTSNQSITQLMDGEAAFAQVFTANSPV